jgi:hypothetical protein
MTWFRRVLLQDAAELWNESPAYPVFNFHPFNSPEFHIFARGCSHEVQRLNDAYMARMDSVPEAIVTGIRMVMSQSMQEAREATRYLGTAVNNFRCETRDSFQALGDVMRLRRKQTDPQSVPYSPSLQTIAFDKSATPAIAVDQAQPMSAQSMSDPAKQVPQSHFSPTTMSAPALASASAARMFSSPAPTGLGPPAGPQPSATTPATALSPAGAGGATTASE